MKGNRMITGKEGRKACVVGKYLVLSFRGKKHGRANKSK
jgi:hypothetical protein